MIPNDRGAVKVQSTMTGEKIRAGFDPAAVTHLMSVLSTVYSDPALAVVREYTTNAIDSHVAAGQTRPVEITCPDAWKRLLVIQDFGVGMNADDIRNVYANYGASTKRESNDFNGMLGIGSKSAYAYSNSFTVVGVKNGVKTIVDVGRDEDGAPLFTIVDTLGTDEGNGVTISIPVKNPVDITRKVDEFCKWLPEGVVLVDGTDLSERSKWELIASNIKNDNGEVAILNMWIIPQRDYHYGLQHRVIMGNVAYALAGDDHNFADQRLAIEVPNGSVVFAPSRESLMDVPVTMRMQAFIKSKYESVFAEKIAARVKDAKTPFEAMKIVSKYNSRFTKNLSYCGKQIPACRDDVISYSPNGQLTHWLFRYNCTSGQSLFAQSRMTYMTLPNTDAVVYGVGDETPTATFRRKLRQYMQREFSVAAYGDVVIVPDRNLKKVEDEYWFSGLKMISAEDISKEVLPRSAPRGGGYGGIKMGGRYHISEPTDNGCFELKSLNSNDKVYYFVKTRAFTNGGWWAESDERMRQIIADFTSTTGVTVAHVYANRLDKFKRDYPNAVELTATSRDAMIKESIDKRLTQDMVDQYAAVECFGSEGSFINFLEFAPDDDPDIKVMRSGRFSSDGYAFCYKNMHIIKEMDMVKDAIAAMKAIKEKYYGRYPITRLNGNWGDPKVIRSYMLRDWNDYKMSKENSQ